MWKNWKKRVYACGSKAALYLAESLGIVLYLAYFFYREWWGIPLLLPVGAAYFNGRCAGWERKKKSGFERQFQECILSVAAGLRAGYSVENAFLKSVPEMRALFGDKSGIARALQYLSGGMKNNVPLERLLAKLAKASGSGWILDFAEIFRIARQSGGNLAEIIGDTVELMDGRLRLRQEIGDIISGRQFEQKIMNFIPFLIVLYIQLANPGYFDELYHNLPGVLFMSGCLAAYLAACAMSEKIARIRVDGEE